MEYSISVAECMTIMRSIRTFVLSLLVLVMPTLPVLARSDDTTPHKEIEATGDVAEIRSLREWAMDQRFSVPERALSAARRALDLALDLDELSEAGGALLVLGHVSSDVDQKEAYYTKARTMFERAEDELGIIRSGLSLGNVYEIRNEPEQALDAYFEGLKALERLGDPQWQAITLNNIGIILKHQGKLEDALEYFERVINFSEGLDRPGLLVHVLNNTSLVLSDLKRFEEAETHLLRMLSIAEEHKDQYFVMVASSNLGSLFNKQGHHSEALPQLRTAWRLSNEVGNLGTKAAISENLGKAYLGLGQYDQALRYAEESLMLAEEEGYQPRQVEALKTISDVYEGAGEYEQALIHYRRYTDIKETVFNTEKTEIIAQMQARYEAERSRRAIATLEQEKLAQAMQAEHRQKRMYAGAAGLLLLTGFFYSRYRLKLRANRLLNAQKEEILKQKSEKEILLQEIHHRVKNNLQIIAGLLGIQAREVYDAEALATLREAQSRVQAITLLHQKLYREENIAKVNMQEYLNDLSTYLIRAFDTDHLTIHVQADHTFLDVDAAVPLGLIANELISNALEHAFTDLESGEILVSLRERAEKGYELEISDNGLGFSSGPPGRSAGTGMRLVESLTRQLRGRLQVESDRGSMFRISFEARSRVS